MAAEVKEREDEVGPRRGQDRPSANPGDSEEGSLNEIMGELNRLKAGHRSTRCQISLRDLAQHLTISSPKEKAD